MLLAAAGTAAAIVLHMHLQSITHVLTVGGMRSLTLVRARARKRTRTLSSAAAKSFRKPQQIISPCPATSLLVCIG